VTSLTSIAVIATIAAAVMGSSAARRRCQTRRVVPATPSQTQLNGIPCWSGKFHDQVAQGT
jgi:hypothetical protein